MSLDFRTVVITIPMGTGNRTIEKEAVFESRVLRAGVSLNGFSLKFAVRDRRFNTMEADTDILSITGNTVKFRVQCQLADKGADDDYSGYVTVLVTADVEYPYSVSAIQGK